MGSRRYYRARKFVRLPNKGIMPKVFFCDNDNSDKMSSGFGTVRCGVGIEEASRLTARMPGRLATVYQWTITTAVKNSSDSPYS